MRLPSLLSAALALAFTGEPSALVGAPDEPTAVVDLHVGVVPNVQRPDRNVWSGIGQAGVVQLRQGHVRGVLTVFSARPTDVSAQLAMRFASVRSSLAATQAFDAHACAVAPGRVGTWFELDAPQLLAAQPEESAAWMLRGIRVFSLAGRLDSALATSAFPSGPERVVGLTTAGRRVAETVMRAGALVDLANLSDMAVTELLELATQLGVPVIATHGSARAVRAAPGAFTDGQLRAIADTGGVVGLTLDRSALAEANHADVSDVVRQLRHLLRVAGPDAVAIGSGFETGAIAPAGLRTAARFPHLGAVLSAAGIPRETLQKVFRDNAMRVLCRGESPADAAATGRQP